MNQSSIKRIIPLGFQWETMDPFLFCVHHEDFYPEGNEYMGPPSNSLKGREIGQDFKVKDGWRMYHGQKIPGFPEHPHRGFETVTVVQKGMVDHADSMGASGRYGGGDVQWMTAGKGIQHSEMFPLLHQKEKNTLELFQIWLNLPKASKFVEPHFKMFWKEDVPILKLKDEKGRSLEVTVIAGKYHSSKSPSPPPNSWAANSNNDISVFTVSLDPGAVWKIPKSLSSTNRMLYFFKGNTLYIEGKEFANYNGIELQAENEVEITNGSEPAKLLLLQGKPIGEPVEQYGPFVMNTKEEIQQAYMDFQRTQFGGWPWKSSDPVHSKSMGRFAKHSDGKEEIK